MFVVFVYLWLIIHSAVFMTHLWIHGMYVCNVLTYDYMYVCTMYVCRYECTMYVSCMYCVCTMYVLCHVCMYYACVYVLVAVGVFCWFVWSSRVQGEPRLYPWICPWISNPSSWVRGCLGGGRAVCGRLESRCVDIKNSVSAIGHVVFPSETWYGG